MTLKRLLLGVLLVWMVVGPVLTQVFGVKASWLPAWHMFRDGGSKIVVVELLRVDGPEPERLDRLALLGFPDRAPIEVRRLQTPADLNRQLETICEVLPPEADVRVHAKRGRMKGWVTFRKGQRNACR